MLFQGSMMEKRHLKFFKGVDLLQCMSWVNQAFEQITKDTKKHYFEKCRFSEVALLAEEPDEEFEDLLKSLSINAMSDEYASLDDYVDTSEMTIIVQTKGWEDIVNKRCIEKVNADPDEIDISSDDSDWKTTIILKLLKKKILRYHLLLHCRCQTSYRILFLLLPKQKCSGSWPLLLKNYKN